MLVGDSYCKSGKLRVEKVLQMTPFCTPTEKFHYSTCILDSLSNKNVAAKKFTRTCVYYYLSCMKMTWCRSFYICCNRLSYSGGLFL